MLPDRPGSVALGLYYDDERLETPKISPKHKWEFDWLVEGVASPEPKSNLFSPRVRVYSQERKAFDDKALVVGRIAMRLWQFNFAKLRLDHSIQYGAGVVDYYLAFGGPAGGEQLFDQEEGPDGKNHGVNTIYVYQINNFDSKLEFLREVAHEYGHATLPPIGGYRAPEYWANGDLGERIYLRYLRDMIADKRLSSEDAGGVSLHDLNGYLRKRVDPLIAAAAGRAPGAELKAAGPESMNAYLGLVLYAQSILPPEVFARSLVLTGSQNATDYPKAIDIALAESATRTLRIPESLRGKAIWIPVANGRVSGTEILETKGTWVKVASPRATLQIESLKSGNL